MGKPDIQSYTTRVTAATTDTQVFTAPWRIRKKYILKKLIITNEAGATSLVKIFDDDLADATTPARGNNTTNALLEFYVPATSTLILTEEQLPYTYFQGGMVAYNSQANNVFMVEIQED